MSSVTHPALEKRFASKKIVLSYLEHQSSDNLREYRADMAELLKVVKSTEIRTVLERNRNLAGDFISTRLSHITGFSPEGYAAFLRQNY